MYDNTLFNVPGINGFILLKMILLISVQKCHPRLLCILRLIMGKLGQKIYGHLSVFTWLIQ